jgi:transposase
VDNNLAHIKIRYFVGIDVSKHTLDFAVVTAHQLVTVATIENAPSAIRALIKTFKELPAFTNRKVLYCCESTGIYTNHLLQCLYKAKAMIVVENPLHIKLSMGLIRDKSDQKDAHRIALFAKRHQNELRLWQAPRTEIVRLRQLSTMRDRLVSVGKILKTPLKDNGDFTPVKLAREVKEGCAESLKAVKNDLDKVEQKMDAIIKSDATLSHLYQLVYSVSGIGKHTATQLLIKTNEFKNIGDPKSFACYAGVAPFKSESGLSVSRARVSHVAAKKLKTLLHICAVNAIRFDPEIRAYYKRRAEVDKKPKMSIINAIRNKLIKRVFACVHQNREFIKRSLPVDEQKVAPDIL